MSSVNVTSVRILNNPALFTDALQFEIEYECLVNLQDDLEWSVVYVGSAETDKYDQTLESVAVGPVSAGNFRFVLEANPPDHSQIPADDIVGVTVLILSCKYRNQEFIRIGKQLCTASSMLACLAILIYAWPAAELSLECCDSPRRAECRYLVQKSTLHSTSAGRCGKSLLH